MSDEASAGGVTVVVPTHRGHARIGDALASLAAQTLEKSRFEVVVVCNGEPDGTAEVVAGVTDLDLRVVHDPVAGVSRAMNTGLRLASRPYVTILDDDDRLAPGFLAGLLAYARPDTITVGRIVDVHPDGREDADNRINRVLVRAAGRRPGVLRWHRALEFNTAKLVPTESARAVGYDEDLASGTDLVFYLALVVADPGLRVFVAPGEDAAYRRHLRSGSVSRQPPGLDFSVTERLRVMARLERLRAAGAPDRRAFCDHLIAGQTRHVARYLDSHPDQRDRVVAAVRDAGLVHLRYDLLGLTPPA